MICSNSSMFLPNRWVFVFSREMRHFSQGFGKRFLRTPKRGGLFEKLRVLGKSMTFRLLSRNEALFASFCWKIHGNAETWYFVRKLDSFGQMKDFSCFFTKWDTFCYFFVKNSCKCRNIAVSSKSWEFWLIRSFSVFFHEMRHVLQLFAQKFVKTPKRDDLFEKFRVHAKSMSFRVFSRNEALFSRFW